MDGLGSIKQFVNVLKTRNDDYIFYSLECNSDKCNDARNLFLFPKNFIIIIMC